VGRRLRANVHTAAHADGGGDGGGDERRAHAAGCAQTLGGEGGAQLRILLLQLRLPSLEHGAVALHEGDQPAQPPVAPRAPRPRRRRRR
jgi:hypothetical protein